MSAHMKALLVLVSCLLSAHSSFSPIRLNSTNHVVIRGPITDEMAATFVYASQLNYTKIQYVYIDSPGGSVSAGEHIVEEIRHRPYVCVVDKAYSMAFVILQACQTRVIRPSGSLMQHQISISGIRGELGKILSTLHHIESMRKRLEKMQAARIGRSVAEFSQLVTNEWWLDASEALEHKCVDDVIDRITCSPAVVKNTVTRTESTITGFFATSIMYEYSACPLIHAPLREMASASVDWTNQTIH